MLRYAPSKITPESHWYDSWLYGRDRDVVAEFA